MTALLILSIVVVFLFSATAILVAVISRQAASDAFRALEQRDVRAQRHVSELLNRLMTVKWEDFAAIQAAEDADEDGGFIVPDRGEDDEGEMEVDDGRWGHLSTLRERLRLSGEEEQLIDEDFDHKGDPRRAAN